MKKPNQYKDSLQFVAIGIVGIAVMVVIMMMCNG